MWVRIGGPAPVRGGGGRRGPALPGGARRRPEGWVGWPGAGGVPPRLSASPPRSAALARGDPHERGDPHRPPVPPWGYLPGRSGTGGGTTARSYGRMGSGPRLRRRSAAARSSAEREVATAVSRVRREGDVSGGVRPQRLARQRRALLWPTDSAPFRGRTPPGTAPTHRPPKALRAPPPHPHRPPQAPRATTERTRTGRRRHPAPPPEAPVQAAAGTPRHHRRHPHRPPQAPRTTAGGTRRHDAHPPDEWPPGATPARYAKFV